MNVMCMLSFFCHKGKVSAESIFPCQYNNNDQKLGEFTRPFCIVGAVCQFQSSIFPFFLSADTGPQMSSSRKRH